MNFIQFIVIFRYKLYLVLFACNLSNTYHEWETVLLIDVFNTGILVHKNISSVIDDIVNFQRLYPRIKGYIQQLVFHS
ncbi:Uncharacterised protein [Dorea longicatena]|nr:Uncharacterised protein [Dorea longicatena]